MLVFIGIGNSDDKLTQKQWASYIANISVRIVPLARKVYGVWFSAPDSNFQNACWGLEILDYNVSEAKKVLEQIKLKFKQDSIAWNQVHDTEFI